MTALTTLGHPCPIPLDDIAFAEKTLGIVFPSYLSRLYLEKGGLTISISGSQAFAITSLYLLAHQYSGICEVFGCSAKELKSHGLTPFAMSENYGDLFLWNQNGTNAVIGNVTLQNGEVGSEYKWDNVEKCVEWYFDRALAAQAEGANVTMKLFGDAQLEAIQQRHRAAYKARLTGLFPVDA